MHDRETLLAETFRMMQEVQQASIVNSLMTMIPIAVQLVRSRSSLSYGLQMTSKGILSSAAQATPGRRTTRRSIRAKRITYAPKQMLLHLAISMARGKI
jgi:hypothetical protein